MDKIGIAGAIREADMQALRNLIDEGYTVISTIDFPRGRATRAAQICASALARSDDSGKFCIFFGYFCVDQLLIREYYRCRVLYG
jgi:hypothetical protein